MTTLRWQLYRALKWLAMAVCPPIERGIIEALEDEQAKRLGAEMGDA